MATLDSSGMTQPSDSLVTITHIVYALHTASIIIGITSAALIVTAFVFGLPSIIAVIINYVKRGETRGTFLDSHFSWQIRTFWWTLLWIVIGVVLLLTVIGIPFAWGVFVVVGIWVIYRIARGWLALIDRRPMPMPD